MPHSQFPIPTTWQLITDMLSDRHARATAFGVNSVLNLPFPLLLKLALPLIFVILGQLVSLPITPLLLG